MFNSVTETAMILQGKRDVADNLTDRQLKQMVREWKQMGHPGCRSNEAFYHQGKCLKGR